MVVRLRAPHVPRDPQARLAAGQVVHGAHLGFAAHCVICFRTLSVAVMCSLIHWSMSRAIRRVNWLSVHGSGGGALSTAVGSSTGSQSVIGPVGSGPPGRARRSWSGRYAGASGPAHGGACAGAFTVIVPS